MKLAALLSLCSCLLLLGPAAGHGAIIYPMPRNAIDRDVYPWSAGVDNATGQFPNTGHWKYMPFGCDCSNGTEPCRTGQSCFWFSHG